jgi:hypothetical protein
VNAGATSRHSEATVRGIRRASNILAPTPAETRRGACSVGLAVKSCTNSCHDGFGSRKRAVHQLCDEATFAGSNDTTIHADVKLALSTLHEFDRDIQLFLDQGSETRCICGGRRSRLAIHDSDIHGEQFTTLGRTHGPAA